MQACFQQTLFDITKRVRTVSNCSQHSFHTTTPVQHAAYNVRCDAGSDAVLLRHSSYTITTKEHSGATTAPARGTRLRQTCLQLFNGYEEYCVPMIFERRREHGRSITSNYEIPT